ncbi:hypothetical protein PEBR_15610 [Penicillium brasilianum]|uniref:DNA2/NAM7 helicase-like C-terminal domain-containing protein n=1 Tax=Penicillium brasilianum TaxID=104259 RepID=A0A1S9RPX4_PENBI|nr:hypothetical protein PEBR_15610 [Penicillium brasilianum]
MPSKATGESSDQAERENWQALNSLHWRDSETVIWVSYEQKSMRNCQSVFDGPTSRVRLPVYIAHTIYKGKLRPGPSNSEPERVGDTWDEFTSKRHHFHGQFLAGVRRLFISVIGNATREEHGTSFENVSQAVVIRDLLAELYSFTTAGGQSIRAEDVMIISPYKAQRRLFSRTLSESGLKVRDNLTVDASQGQEAPIVLLSLTKPGEVATSLGFMANKERLNVALSRAQEVLIVVGNLSVWGEGFVKSLAAKNNSVKVLRELLMDVKPKNHVLTWVDKRVVTEVDPKPSYGYYSHIRPTIPANQPRHTNPISSQDAMEINAPDEVPPAIRHASQGGLLPPVSLPLRPPPPMAEEQMRMDDLQDLESRRQRSLEEPRMLQKQAALSQTQVQWYDRQIQELRRRRCGRDERSRSPRP